MVLEIKNINFTRKNDEIIIAEDLESEEELLRLRQNLDQQLLQLKVLFQNLQINFKESY